MRILKYIYVTIFILTSGCSKSNDYNFIMDYPVAASRISLGGEVTAIIDCKSKTKKVVKDTSEGIFSRHIQKRIFNICYGRSDTFEVTYIFIPERGVTVDALATQLTRMPELPKHQ